MNKAAVLGIGLIGGSLATCLKQRSDLTVFGFDENIDTLRFAEAKKMIDCGYTDLEEAVSDADVIFLAVPIHTSKILLRALAQFSLKEDCIITDVGSTKGEIVALAEALSSIQGRFIGGHPMAGSHQSGVQAAHSILFENAYYVLTPQPEVSLFSVERLSRLLIQATKAEVVIMQPEYHDQVVGAISHLPHLIASGLVNQVSDYNDDNEWYHRLAAGGFRDLTRIAAAHPIMWRDIFLSNRQVLIDLLDDWVDEMTSMQVALREEDQEKIESFFRRAKEAREKLPTRKTGGIAPVFESYIDILDRPGVIADIVIRLAEKGINLKNIHIMENREDQAGTLQLIFRDEEEWKAANLLLREQDFTVL